MTIKKPEIVGLGVSTLDLLMRVDEFPNRETVQRTDESALQGGGPVSTALVTAARLGASTRMLDRLGLDWRGDFILEEFLDAGVGVQSILRGKGASALASVWVRRSDGARTIAFSAGTVPELAPGDLPDGLVESAGILHLNGRHWEAGLEAARRARANGVPVSFDGGAGRYRDQIRELLPFVDIAIVAREWAEAFSRSQDLNHAAAAIHHAGPGLVGITDGIRGSWLWPPDAQPFHQPAFIVPEVIDTTGCGDAYHGAFLTGLVRDWPLSECARIAAAVAALNTKALGGRGNLVNLETARQFANEAEGHSETALAPSKF